VADRHEEHPDDERRSGWQADDQSGADRGRGSRFWGWQPQSVAMDMQRTPPPNGFAIAALITGILGIVFTPIPFFVGLLIGAPFDLLAVAFGIAGIRAGRRLGGIGVRPSAAGLGLGALALLAIPFGAGWAW
jgi:hypothetical protein